MPATACLYGLGVRANRPLAALAGLPGAQHTDVDILLGELPPDAGSRSEAKARQPYVSSLVTDGRLELFATRLPHSGDLRLDYDDGTVVVIESRGRRIWADWPADLTADHVAGYLLGPVMGVVLRLRGIVCLHASAIAVGDGAIALVGASGAGKSTTAASFSRLGHAVMADDLVPVVPADGSFAIVASRPRLRLWPDSAGALFGAVEALPRAAPEWDKRMADLSLLGGKAAPPRAPLCAIYFLAPRREASAGVAIEDMPAREATMALITDSFASKYQDRKARAQEFDLAADMVRKLPLRRVSAPADLRRLPELCEAILADHACVARLPRN
jgi:hypothetical protein